jgi:ATP synthase protein I
MSEDRGPPSLEDLDNRLRKAREAQRPEPEPERPGSNMGLALRVAIEMVAALGVGGVLGWLLDGWLGTRPWLLVVFLFLGVAAGILNAVRTASRLMAAAEQDRRGDGEGGQGPSPD